MARNQSTSGLRVSWKIVPAVTEVWCPLAALQQDQAHRSILAGALAALQQDQAHRPVLIAITTRASETLRPPQAEQVVPARLLGGKPRLKLAQVPRVFLHRPPYYRLCQPESSK